jgi:hypothetical protein
MKYLAGLLLTFMLINQAAATDLCEASCQLTITFPAGGSIAANEDMVITFGSGGILDLGITGTINSNPQPPTTDFSAGGQLLLAKGESISFDEGGALFSGTGGNMTYTDMTFASAGGASLTAVGDNAAIVIDNLTITGGLNITLIAGSIAVNGTLTVTSGSTLNLVADTGASTASVCSLQDAGGIVLSSGTGAIDTADSCSTISDILSLAEGSLSVLTADPNALLVVSGSVVILPIIEPVDVTLNIQELTPSQLSSLPDDTALPTDDGKTCRMISGQCIAASGVEYIVVEGKLVPVAEGGSIEPSADGAGRLGAVILVLLTALPAVFRVRSRGG